MVHCVYCAYADVTLTWSKVKVTRRWPSAFFGGGTFIFLHLLLKITLNFGDMWHRFFCGWEKNKLRRLHVKVSKPSYDACSLSGDASTILNCSTPRQLRRFTMFFEPFQAIPNAPEFHTGHSYYFISKSTDVSGLSIALVDSSEVLILNVLNVFFCFKDDMQWFFGCQSKLLVVCL